MPQTTDGDNSPEAQAARAAANRPPTPAKQPALSPGGNASSEVRVTSKTVDELGNPNPALSLTAGRASGSNVAGRGALDFTALGGSGTGVELALRQVAEPQSGGDLPNAGQGSTETPPGSTDNQPNTDRGTANGDTTNARAPLGDLWPPPLWPTLWQPSPDPALQQDERPDTVDTDAVSGSRFVPSSAGFRPTPFTWTGFYVGRNAGGILDHSFNGGLWGQPFNGSGYLYNWQLQVKGDFNLDKRGDVAGPSTPPEHSVIQDLSPVTVP
jgi:hypothetical protein